MTLGAKFRKILIFVAPTLLIASCVSSWLIMGGLSTRPPSNNELFKTVASAKPIIVAIRAYEADHKKPPKILTDLIPKYLSAVPKPRGPAEGGWVFLSSENPSSTDLPEGRDWALAIKVDGTKGFLQFGDYFAYHSDGLYESGRYGGPLLRQVDGWGYYRE